MRIFEAFLVKRGMPTTVGRITREHVETFIADQLRRWAPTTAATRYRCLQQFFRWLVEDGEIAASPMANMRLPSVPEVPVPVVADDSRAWDWVAAARQRQPKLFAHWHLVSSTRGRLVGAV